MRPLLMLLVLLISVVLAAPGCGTPAKPSEKGDINVPLKDVPEAAMKAAKEKLDKRGVTIENAFKRPNGNYEIRGKNKDGQTKDVQVTPEGKIVEED